MSEELTTLPTEAAGYLRGCNVELKEGDLLFTADQMLAYALENRLAPDAQPEPSAPMAVEPTAHTPQWWMHRLDMEKTQAWQQGYAQGLHRATPTQAPCDGGRCGVGGYCAKCPAVPPEPLEWRTFVYNGFIKFAIGGQTFRLDYAADDELLPSQQAAQLEWMRSILHGALSRLSATPPRSALTEQDANNLALEVVKGGKSVQWLIRQVEAAHGIGNSAVIAADGGQK